MIRRYREADLEDVLSAWAEASAVAHSFLSPEFQSRERREIRDVYLPMAETWVWEDDGQVVGFISLLENEVGAIFVDSRFQGRGIGRVLMDQARSLKGELEVEVFEKNAQGRAFYERYGFEQISTSIHEQSGFEMIRLRLAAPAAQADG